MSSRNFSVQVYCKPEKYPGSSNKQMVWIPGSYPFGYAQGDLERSRNGQVHSAGMEALN